MQKIVEIQIIPYFLPVVYNVHIRCIVIFFIEILKSLIVKCHDSWPGVIGSIPVNPGLIYIPANG